jgi:hypothetical protein
LKFGQKHARAGNILTGLKKLADFHERSAKIGTIFEAATDTLKTDEPPRSFLSVLLH